MKKILEYYTKAQITRKCGVTHATAYNWFNNNNMPYWAIEKLGFEITAPRRSGVEEYDKSN